MKQNKPLNLRMLVFASLFTALIVIGGYLSFAIPLNPVPIVLSDFFVMLAGLFLGASWGTASVGLFLFVGLIGLPVFSGGKAGLAALFGPTGGFLFGFLVGVWLIGWLSGKGKPTLVKDLVSLILGNLIFYSMGVSWLKLILKATWGESLALGFLPFIPGIIIKIIVAVILTKTLRSYFQQLTTNPTGSVEKLNEYS